MIRCVEHSAFMSTWANFFSFFQRSLFPFGCSKAKVTFRKLYHWKSQRLNIKLERGCYKWIKLVGNRSAPVWINAGLEIYYQDLKILLDKKLNNFLSCAVKHFQQKRKSFFKGNKSRCSHFNTETGKLNCSHKQIFTSYFDGNGSLA